jgi:hypothetical protein
MRWLEKEKTPRRLFTTGGSMRFRLAALMLLAGSSALALWLAPIIAAIAADPIIGAWKLNPAESKFSANSQSDRQQTEVYRLTEAGEIELTYGGVKHDGSRNSLVVVWPARGGVAKLVKGDANGQTWIETLVKPGEWYMTAMRE